MPLIIKNSVGGGTNLMTTDKSGNLDVDLFKLYGNESFPVGTIMLYSGSIAALASGWYVCNGQHGTPNLNGRIPVCVNHPNDISKKITGGTSIASVPKHTHTVTVGTVGNHSHNMAGKSFSMSEVGNHSHTQHESPQNGARGVLPSCHTTPHGIPIYTQVVDAWMGYIAAHKHTVNFGGSNTSSTGNHSHTKITTSSTGSSGNAAKGSNLPEHTKVCHIMKVR